MFNRNLFRRIQPSIKQTTRISIKPFISPHIRFIKTDTNSNNKIEETPTINNDEKPKSSNAKKYVLGVAVAAGLGVSSYLFYNSYINTDENKHKEYIKQLTLGGVPYVEYYVQGSKIKEQCTKVNGVKQGPFKIYTTYGNVAEEGIYVKGLKHGKCLERYYHSEHRRGGNDDNTMIEYTYINGIKEGECNTYNVSKSGSYLRESCQIKNNKREGIETTYYPNYKTKSINKTTTYVNNVKHGPVIYYERDGSKRWTVIYENDKINGIYEEYDVNSNDDKIILKCLYKDDKKIKVLFKLDNEGRNCVIEDGEQIVYKACKHYDLHGYATNVIVELKVPANSERVTTYAEDKVRVKKATVMRMLDLNGKELTNVFEATSFVHKDKTLVYKKGETIVADDYDADLEHDCGGGINAHVHLEQCLRWF